MTIPLDRLYHFIENTAQEIYGDRVIIYRFWPHGSKNINDLNRLHEYSWKEHTSSLAIWCHDQEPLNHEYYKQNLRYRGMDQWDCKWDEIATTVKDGPAEPKNLNWYRTWFEKNILLHSEKRSHNLEKYKKQDNLVPVYYWNHALLALDWYRYAQHENFDKCVGKTFLVYNRAWTGTREYRLRFVDLVIQANLADLCKTSFNPVDPEGGTHYQDHDFVNQAWQPHTRPEQFLSPTPACADSSGDFVTKDYKTTDIEVVLETLFDDDRLHLTEKTCRPLACGQPFILAATHGSLSYLHSYGFKTWGDIWDETYDRETDPVLRLEKIVELMQDIASWDTQTRQEKMSQARLVADHNRRRFFSEDFFQHLMQELKENLESAFQEVAAGNNYQPWINLWIAMLQDPVTLEILKNRTNPLESNFDSVNFLIVQAKEKLTKKAGTV